MKILHIVESAATGVGRHVLDLADGAIRAGHQTDVIYSPTREDVLFRAGRERLTTVRFDAVPMRRNPGPWDLPAVLTVRRLIRRNGPYDIIHGHSSKGGLMARLAGIGQGSRIVFTPHAISTQDPLLNPVVRAVFWMAELSLSLLTDRIVAVSSAECEHIAGLGVARRKLAVIPNGVGRPAGPSRAEARQALKLDPDLFVTGFVGRISRQKALDVLIAAFAPVANRDPRARLVVVGDGKSGAAARAQAEQLGCARQVVWLGVVDALQCYPAFDLFAQPSRYEGFSYAVLEAASFGVAILTTDVGGSREAVTDGVSGIIVPPDAPEKFAAAFAALADDKPKLTSLGKAALAGMGAIDGRQRMVDATLALYASLLKV